MRPDDERNATGGDDPLPSTDDRDIEGSPAWRAERLRQKLAAAFGVDPALVSIDATPGPRRMARITGA